MKQFSRLFLLSIAYVTISVQAHTPNDVNVELEDEFLSALLRASQEDVESDSSHASESLQAFAEMNSMKQEVVEEPSFLKKYALSAAITMIMYYGRCKSYAKQWLEYVTSFVIKSE